jgi:hypothetical protein
MSDHVPDVVIDSSGAVMHRAVVFISSARTERPQRGHDDATFHGGNGGITTIRVRNGRDDE